MVNQLKVRVNFTDNLGYPEELESALTAMVVIPGVTPVITITADPPSVTEGTAATFTITATPAPTITLTVKVKRHRDSQYPQRHTAFNRHHQRQPDHPDSSNRQR